MKALEGAFNQEKALVGAFSVIVKYLRIFVWSSNTHRAVVGLHRELRLLYDGLPALIVRDHDFFRNFLLTPIRILVNFELVCRQLLTWSDSELAQTGN